jgi:hypothetical protein
VFLSGADALFVHSAKGISIVNESDNRSVR